MKWKKAILSIDSPILPGSTFMVKIKCGKQNCKCSQDKSKLHTVYQWSGLIDGKNTTRTLSKDMFIECKKRINNYKKLQKNLKKIINRGLKNSPWVKKQKV